MKPVLRTGMIRSSVKLVALGVWLCLESFAAESSDLHEQPISEADREHWSFRPLARPDLPAVKDAPWIRNPIDRFILAKLERAGFDPLPPADRATLLRRITYDLTGLPPKPADIETFLSDSSDDAYERVVERLLDSPAYGERWAQHWLDLARFAESDGFEHDVARPEAWRYRDWVIDALNRDLPFDEFVRFQLAGDELRPGDEAASIATGFLLAGPDMPDINLQDERRHMVLNEITSTVGAVFLGLQIGCAQCHDHKFDPLSQADFYRLRAVFESAELLKPPASKYRVVREATGNVPVSHLMIRGDFRRPGPELEPGFPRICDRWQTSGDSQEEGMGRRTALAHWLTRPDHPVVLRVIVNRLWQDHFGFGLSRSPSDVGIMGDEPTHAQLLDWLATELPRQGWSLKQMHRLLVTSATYRQSSRPSGDGSSDPAWQRGRQQDPENRLFWRANRRRLEGEAIRDFILSAADRLSDRRGGRGVMAPLPQELLSTVRKDHWKVSSDEEDHRRRSIYLFVRRNLRFPLFEAFDRPDTIASCPRRNRSTTAPQALVLFNSEFSLDSARHLAGLLYASHSDDASRIRQAYLLTLGRHPTGDEQTLTQDFVRSQSLQLRDEARNTSDLALPFAHPENVDPYVATAWTDFCLALMNSNEFVYVD